MTNKMENILNITNGDCAVDIMKEANIQGIFLPWRDILHEGPVPQCDSLDALSEIRANYIIEQGWGTPEKIRQDFIARDNVIKSSEQFEKIILWFEHDLYDQLQILQILDWFYHNPSKKPELSIICIDQYLGTLSAKEMASLFEYEEAITETHLQLAHTAWSAFCSDTPEQWQALLQQNTDALPFLAGAITRLLEEYPGYHNGLSRTANHALNIIHNGEKHPGKIFAKYQTSEERRFMGDSSFWNILHEFLESSPAVLELPKGQQLSLPSNPEQVLSITQQGINILSGESNWTDITTLDKWIGGVHLTSHNLWYWNTQTASISR